MTSLMDKARNRQIEIAREEAKQTILLELAEAAKAWHLNTDIDGDFDRVNALDAAVVKWIEIGG